MTEVSGGNELQRDQTLLAGKKSGHTGNEAGRLEEKKSKKKKASGSKNVKKQSKRENNLKLTKGHTEGGTHASDGQSEMERERDYLQRNIDKTFFLQFQNTGLGSSGNWSGSGPKNEPAEPQDDNFFRVCTLK